MRNLLRIYSNVLTLNDATYRMIKFSRAAVPFALLLFFTMTLIAGCGRWLAFPGLVSRPILSEQIGTAADIVDSISERLVPAVDESLLAISQDNLSFALGELLPPDASVTPEALAEVMRQAGLTSGQLLTLVGEEVAISPAVVAELQAGTPSAEFIEAILEETAIDAVELKAILTRASLATASGTGLSSIPITSQQLQDLIVNLALAPEQVRAFTVRIGLDPQEVAALTETVNEIPEQADGIIRTAQSTVETLEPPLGSRFSQTVRLFGQWLSSPFVMMADWLPLVLVGLLVAKLLGGRGTITQHLVAASLAVAPAFLLFFSFASLSGLADSFSVTMAAALIFLGRILALLAFVWAFLILVKSLSVAHEFSYWRAVATMALTYVVLTFGLPLIGLLVSGQLFGV